MNSKIRPHHEWNKRSVQKTVVRLLGQFQLLEFALKAYIGSSYSLIKQAVEPDLHFGYCRKDVDDYPLERLMSVFSKLSQNSDLIVRLNQLRKERNHIAHQSLLITMGPMYSVGAVEDKHIEYSILEDEVTECLQLVIAEARQLRAIKRRAI